MRIQKAQAKLIVIAIVLGATAAIWAASAERRATAANGGAWKTGMYGLARGQTVRTNAANESAQELSTAD